jgi:hypothetical protein
MTDFLSDTVRMQKFCCLCDVQEQCLEVFWFASCFFQCDRKGIELLCELFNVFADEAFLVADA